MDFRVQIRWMILRDMDDVLRIENNSFEFPWDEDEFIRVLRHKNCIGMVAAKADAVLGYMVYELNKDHLHVLNFAVDFDYQRMSVGTQMIRKLLGKLSKQRRTHIVLEVRESNLAAQVFFRSQGFEAVEILRDYYEDSPEDAYVMRGNWSPQWSQKEAVEPKRE